MTMPSRLSRHGLVVLLASMSGMAARGLGAGFTATRGHALRRRSDRLARATHLRGCEHERRMVAGTTCSHIAPRMLRCHQTQDAQGGPA
jgi:hypothetical protein